jgi:hypothetical protein
LQPSRSIARCRRGFAARPSPIRADHRRRVRYRRPETSLTDHVVKSSAVGRFVFLLKPLAGEQRPRPAGNTRRSGKIRDKFSSKHIQIQFEFYTCFILVYRCFD